MAIGAGQRVGRRLRVHPVIRVDPVALEVVKRINLPDQIWDVTFAAGAVWATEPNLGYVVRINPKTNKVRRRIKIPGIAGPANLRYGAGAVWVGSLLGRRVFRIDPRTNKVTSIRVGRTPRSLAASDSAIWVSNHLSNTVSRINPKTRKVVATIRVGKQPENAAIADDGTIFGRTSARTRSHDRPTHQQGGEHDPGSAPSRSRPPRPSATSGSRAPVGAISIAFT